jgi:hypothetical protein
LTFPVLLIKPDVLRLQIRPIELLCVSLKSHLPIKEASPLLILQGNSSITTSKNYPYSTEVGLSTITHEALEVHIDNAVPFKGSQHS